MTIRRVLTTLAAGSMLMLGATACGSGDALDNDSKNWFTAFCEGLAPMQQMESRAAEMTDPAAAGSLLTEIGTSFTAASENLASLPAPNIDGGDEFAPKIVDGLAQMGTAFTDAADQMATDPMAASSSIQSALTNNPMQEIQNTEISEETQKAIQEIPACKTLGI